MKPGSLVVPKYAMSESRNILFTITCYPFYPTPNTVCTVQSIEPDGRGDGYLQVEETEILVDGKRGVAAFTASKWTEIQPPEENSAVEEVNNIIEESSLQPI